MMARTNQGGSILGFVIIGGVMALLLIGGAYFVRHNLTEVMSGASGADDGGSMSGSFSQDDTDTEDDTGVEQSGDEENSRSDEDETATQDESEPATTPTQDEPAQDTADELAEGGHHTTPDHAAPDAADNLPQTGPADVLLAGFLFSAVVGILAAYLRSRFLPSSL